MINDFLMFCNSCILLIVAQLCTSMGHVILQCTIYVCFNMKVSWLSYKPRQGAAALVRMAFCEDYPSLGIRAAS